ncbi:uncharacterized protein [Rutidosis leptorrhynchoides]|uniref:uncharacterized protein isoform X2 n=1 Tax=Rutidosis leptorrhynchoides TaxID=125765 RepID=UPI003A9A5717
MFFIAPARCMSLNLALDMLMSSILSYCRWLQFVTSSAEFVIAISSSCSHTNILHYFIRDVHVRLFIVRFVTKSGELSFHIFVFFFICLGATAARALKSVLKGILSSLEGWRIFLRWADYTVTKW